jgi:hypothetical protein
MNKQIKINDIIIPVVSKPYDISDYLYILNKGVTPAYREKFNA